MKKNRFLSEEDFLDFYHLYVTEDKSLKDTAGELDVSVTTASKFANRYNLIEKKKELKMPIYNEKKVKELYSGGTDIVTIALMLGYEERNFVRWAERNGFRKYYRKRGEEEMNFLKDIEESMQRKFRKGDILKIDKKRYLVIGLYPHHLVARRYIRNEWSYCESFRYVDFFIKEMEESRKKQTQGIA